MSRRWLSVIVAIAMVIAGVAAVTAGSAAAAPRTAAPTAASGSFGSLSPARLLDTRSGVGAAKSAVKSGGVLTLSVTGVGGVPASNVGAVVLNVTVTAPTGGGYVTVYPDGGARPTASNLNFVAGETVPNLVVVRVPASGKIDFYNGSNGSVQLVADVSGYYTSGTPSIAGAFGALSPARVLDTRNSSGAVKPGAMTSLKITGIGGVPASNVGAVVLNVTVTAPTGGGYVTVYPDGGARPTASNLNFIPGQTVPNLVVVRVPASGKIDFYNGSNGSVQLVADVSGYYLSGAPSAAGAFGALSPARVLDTRTGAGALPRGAVTSLKVTGIDGVPASNVAAVVLNMTVTAPTGCGYITVYPDGDARPTASNLNFTAGQTVPNLVVVRVPLSGKIDLYNGSSGTVQLVADVSGYYLLGTPDTTPPSPITGLTATPTQTSVALSWTNPPDTDFAGVMIRRASGAIPPSSPTDGTLVTDTAAGTTWFTDTGLTAGTQYSYALFAHDAVPNYATAVTKSVTTLTTPDTSPPGPVTSVVATPGQNTVALSWTNPTDSDFAGVMIRRALGATAPASPTAGALVTNATGTSFTDSGLSSGTQYSYALFAHDAVPNYAAAATKSVTTSPAPDTTPPGPVTAVAATAGRSIVALSWTNPGDPDFAGVMIRRATGTAAPTSPSDGTLVTDTTAGSTTFTDISLSAGTQYSYALFAHDTAGNYATAAVLTTSTQPANTPPGPVTGVSAAAQASSVVLSWTNPSGANFAGVMIRRANGSTAPASPTAGTLVTDTAGTSFTDTGVAGSTQYSYAFFAHDGSADYASAATITVTTSACDFVAIQHVSGGISQNTTWSPACAGVYVIDGAELQNGATLSIAAGTLIKVTGPLTVDTGASLVIAGTAHSPVIVTSIDDDSAGGDTGGDGPSDPTVNGREFIATNGGSVSIVHADVRWIANVVVGDWGGSPPPMSVQSVTIQDSSFVVARSFQPPFPWQSHYWGTLNVLGCTNGSITGNAFEHVALQVSYCPAVVADNAFTTTDHPLTLSDDDRLDLVAMSGSNANTFSGGGDQLAVSLAGTVPSNTTAVLASGPTFVVSGVAVEGVLDIGAGALVKVQGMVEVETGGLLDLAGTAAQPVVVTSINDDSVGGDTGGDGPSDPTTLSREFIATNGGSVDIVHADVRWISNVVVGEWGGSPPPMSVQSVTIQDSLFVVAQAFQPEYSWQTPYWGALDVLGCANGSITGNTFEHVALQLSYCSASVTGNTFTTTDAPLTLYEDDALNLVALSGPNANVFVGSGDQLAVSLSGTVPSNSTLILAPGPTFVVSGMAVEGVLDIGAGALVKVQGMVEVETGGLLDLAGTAAQPVVVTSINDDSVGGDTGGDGPSDPTTLSREFIATNGGSVSIVHADVRWISNVIVGEWDGNPPPMSVQSVTIQDSSFSVAQAFQPEYSWQTPYWGTLDVLGCMGGTITGNTFEHVALQLSYCPSVVSANTFTTTDAPLTLYEDDALNLVALSGPNTNTFTGSGDQLAVSLSGTVPTNSTLLLAPGPTFVVSSVAAEGVLDIEAGALVKVQGMVEVETGGTLDLAGTTAQPVVVTSINDDSVGGDTGDDGPSDPTALSREFIATNGGSVDIVNADVRWIANVVVGEWNGSPPAQTVQSVTIQDSSFVVAQAFQPDYSWQTPYWGTLDMLGCADGSITGNTFEHVSLQMSYCSADIADNTFTTTDRPLTVYGDNALNLVALSGPDANTFGGTGDQRAVEVGGSSIPDYTTWTVDGAGTHAVLLLDGPVGSSHALGVVTGSVALLPGTVVKGTSSLFDLGPDSDFSATGSPSQPVVFTAADDDSVGGDTNGDGTATTPGGSASNGGILDNIFRSDQGGDWSILSGAAGVDLDRVGPGTAEVQNAVVRYTNTALAACLVCTFHVHQTDFEDVEVGVSQAFYFVPLAPCQSLMGQQILNGGNPIWNPADATGNYWGGAGGPSTDVNWVEIASTFAGQEDQYEDLIKGLPTDELNVVSSARDNMLAQWGDTIPNFNLTNYASVNVSVQFCTIPVINIAFPVIVVPVDFADYYDAPIHSSEDLAAL